MLAGGAFGVTVYTLVLTGPAAIIAGNVLCLGTGVIPGSILLVYGWKARKEEKLLIQFSAWVKTYRRIPLNDLARNLGKTRFETEAILARAVDRGVVQGIVDRTTDEFVVQSSIGQQVFVDKCPHCSAVINRWFLPEDRLVCSYCGQPILAASAASNARRPP